MPRIGHRAGRKASQSMPLSCHIVFDTKQPTARNFAFLRRGSGRVDLRMATGKSVVRQYLELYCGTHSEKFGLLREPLIIL